MSKNFNDLLTDKRINPNIHPSEVVVLRHAPWKKTDSEWRKNNWRRMTKDNPELFSNYQETQVVEKVNDMLSEARYVAAFIGFGSGKALFVGLYEKKGEPYKTTVRECRERMQREGVFAKMDTFEIGNNGDYFTEYPKDTVFQHDLKLMKEFYPNHRGQMVIGWNCGDRNWYRWAHENEFPVLSP